MVMADNSGAPTLGMPVILLQQPGSATDGSAAGWCWVSVCGIRWGLLDEMLSSIVGVRGKKR